MNTIIRDYQPADLPAVIAMVQTDFTTQDSHIGSFLDGATAFVCDDGGVRGVVAIRPPREANGKRQVALRLHTDTQYRRRGVGQQLWQAVNPLLSAAGAELVTTQYRCDSGDGTRFFSARGFKPWFHLHDLEYTGPAFPEPQLEAIHYEDRFFAEYLTIINDGFTDMRRTNDIEPNVIFGPASFTDDKLRQDMLDNRENLYVFLAGGEMIGLAELEGGADGNTVDTLAVKPSHRGRGLGRAITQFCINRMRERGVERVFIDVVGTNTVARRLYDSLGCVPVQTLESARLWLKP